MSPFRVVVVGGGNIGGSVALELAKKAKKGGLEVTVVDRRDYFEQPIGSVRAVVDSTFFESTSVTFSSLFGGKEGVTFVQGSVLSVGEEAVTLEGGDVLPFDACVVATGSRYGVFTPSDDETERKTRQATFVAFAERVESATSVVIVGGGPVGIEIAGEIAHAHKGKKITLIHSNDSLISRNVPAKASAAAARILEEMGVRVLLGERLEDGAADAPTLYDAAPAAPREYTTTKGTKVEADLVIWGIGSKPATTMLEGSFASAISDDGRGVHVEPTFLVRGSSNVFAVGDLAALAEPKMAANGKNHVAVAVANVLALAGKKEPKKTYGGAMTEWPVATCIGPEHTVSAFPFCGGIVTTAGFMNAKKLGFMTSKPPM